MRIMKEYSYDINAKGNYIANRCKLVFSFLI